MSGQQGAQQSASRTDDLLAGDTADQEADQGFGGGSSSAQVQTGMEGIGNRAGAGSGNQQAAKEQPGTAGEAGKPRQG
jgi:hypothetical protein